MSEEERALRERLAALEREVRAESAGKRAEPKAAAARTAAAAAPARGARAIPAKVDRKAEIAAELNELNELNELEELGEPARRRSAARPGKPDLASDVGSALELARRAQGVKQELARPLRKGEKSWLVSAGVSTVLGPVGWLYAGSLREAVPAAAAWVALGYLLSFLPTMLLLPMLMVALPISGLAGVMYALAYNREGGRQRLLGAEKTSLAKKLRGGD